MSRCDAPRSAVAMVERPLGPHPAIGATSSARPESDGVVHDRV